MTGKRKQPVPANLAPDGPAVMDAMQETVNLDRFYDRNPFKIKPRDYPKYLRQIVEVNRRQRAQFIEKEERK